MKTKIPLLITLALFMGATMPHVWAEYTIDSDATITGTLTLTGGIIASGNANLLGNDTGFGHFNNLPTFPGMHLLYEDAGTSAVRFRAFRDGNSWHWEHRNGSNIEPQMLLNNYNQLYLRDPHGVNDTMIRLNPMVGGNSWLKNGRLGIGLTSPGYPLEVAGIISSKSGGFRLPDGTIIAEAGDLGGADGYLSLAGPHLAGGNVDMNGYDLTLGGEARDRWANVTSVAVPTPAHDAWSVGTVWVTQPVGTIYLCTDNSIGAAVWTLIYDPTNPPGSGNGDFKANGSVAMTDDLHMGDGTHRITHLADPEDDQDAVTKAFVIDSLNNVSPQGGITMGQFSVE